MRFNRGSTKLIVLIVVAAVIAIGGIIFLVSQNSQSNAMTRIYHCNACDKDFKVNLNELGTSQPTCPECKGTDVAPVKKSDQ